MVWIVLLLMSLLPSVLRRLLVLIIGALYPAYASCKAVQSRNAREYVHWMMYWIVLAAMLTMEPVVDAVCASCTPFYAQLKMGLVLWLQSPSRKGASLIFRKVILPRFARCETAIDAYLVAFKVMGFRAASATTKCITELVVRSVLSHMSESHSTADLIPSDLRFNAGASGSTWSNPVLAGKHSGYRTPTTMSSPRN